MSLHDGGYSSASSSVLTSQTSLESVVSSIEVSNCCDSNVNEQHRSSGKWKKLRDRLHEATTSVRSGSNNNNGKFGTLLKLAERESKKSKRTNQPNSETVAWSAVNRLEERVEMLETTLERTQMQAVRLETSYNLLYLQVQMLLEQFRPLDGKVMKTDELKRMMDGCFQQIRNRDYVLRHVEF